jgi:hypothetical protein
VLLRLESESGDGGRALVARHACNHQENSFDGDLAHVPSMHTIISYTYLEEHRRTAWGVQKGGRRPQAARPVGGPPLKRP